MTHYLHHIPGRLRIKSPLLKVRENQERATRSVARLKGVQTVDCNPTTGSVTVFYDSAVADYGQLVGVFQGLGYFDQARAISNEQYIRSAVTKTGHLIKGALFGSALDAALAGTPLSYLGLFV